MVYCTAHAAHQGRITGSISVSATNSSFLSFAVSKPDKSAFPSAQTDCGAHNVPKLHKPSGPFGVGRVRFDWIDKSRFEALSDSRSAHRELMVYVWYPARSSRGTKSAALLPGAAAIDRSSGAAQMKDAVFTAYTAGSFQTARR